MTKLERLADEEGLDVDEMLEKATFDSIAPGICTNPDCNYTTTVEPDQTEGWCEDCQTNTVQSCLVLAGII
jgi:ssDNA-binding Zn-finger/Zn-ribbon topoisomerase 1